jgi:osmotically inducible protein OsmC
MDKIKPLFTATATATGGRNGHTEASDGSVSADLSVPKEMGGPGKPHTTTPEHLFAAGYAACFGVRWISSPSSTKRMLQRQR